MAFRILLLSLFLVVFQSNANAAPKLPDVLQDWTAWVMRDQPESNCPLIAGDEQRMCLWFSGLDVISAKDGASFELNLKSFNAQDVKIQLPGDEINWPKEVMLDGKPAVVLDQDNTPQVMINSGEHRVTGKFIWDAAPQSLTVPEQIALVTLSHNGKQIANPIIQQSQLTLAEGAEQSIEPTQNSLTLRIYRQLQEAVPMRLVTQIELDVSGRAREVSLGKLAPLNTQLEKISSEIPARVDPDGNLIVQVKSGSWQITTESHYSESIQSTGPIKQADDNEVWPADELWVYQPNVSVRSVSFSNLDSIDTQQTDLPEVWKSLTAWKLAQGDALEWSTQSRGSENIQSNKLHLVRDAWLDFSAENWTLRDSIRGELYSDWRLVMTEPYQLGSISRDEMPLVVINYENGRGVELRSKAIALQAMSRIDAANFNNSLGWTNDFESVQMNLNLPPGWSVFTASGANSAGPTWVSKWNLWDIFWILLITVATARLLGIGWGVLSVIVLVLNYHEANAPVWVWMALLISAALIKAVSHPVWRKIFIAMQAISALVLALIAIPYAIQQVRQAIYPQLESTTDYFSSALQAQYDEASYTEAAAPAAAPAYAPAPMEMDSAAMSESMEEQADHKELLSRRATGAVAKVKKPVIEKPDQSAQTGPAQPQWQWHRVVLSWSGPVQASESFSVWFISPTMERIFSFLRVTGIFLLAFGLLKGVGRMPVKASVNSLLICVAFFLLPNNSSADIPSPELLTELKTELSKPPACLPDCLGNSETNLTIANTTLEIKQKLQAFTALSVKLPAFTDAQLQTVRLDGKSAILQRSADELYVWIPEGVHQLEVQARLLGSAVEVTFSDAPRNVKVSAQDWTFEGLNENRLPNNAIKFEYVEKNKDEPMARFPATVITPFTRVERTITLGQEWSVSTRVIRIAPEVGAIALKVPLLPGEHVLSEGSVIEDNRIAVNLRPDMSETSWESKLDLTNQLELATGKDTGFYESWKFIPSTYWHVEFEGFPALADDKSNNWQPEFLPFPNEKLIASIRALKPAEGVSLTFDNLNLQFTPGERLTRSLLTTSFRSTKGGEHEFILPPESVIETVTLDGESLPRIDSHANPKISFSPGKHQVSISWKNDLAMSFWTKSLPVSLKQVVSNINLNWQVPSDRWILFVSGATQGPAVLFWGSFVLIIASAILLGRSKLTPVSSLSWVVLGAGLSTTSLWVGIVIVAWFVLLQWRGRSAHILAETPFNFLQLLIGFLSVVMVLSLVFSVPKSLLGTPDMGIVGNGSYAAELKWYQDRVINDLPQVWIISLPMWLYRVSMLVWALWLAFKFIDWLRWGWDQFSAGGAWKQPPPKAAKAKPVKDSAA